MVSPQIENGYTKIANELFDAIICTRINGEARQCFDLIVRKTYGYGKKEDRISISQFVLFTGINKSCVCRAINKLIQMNLVIKKDNNYAINKMYNTWRPLSKKITNKMVSKKITGVIQKDNRLVSKKRHTKETITKETITKDSKPKYINITKQFFEDKNTQEQIADKISEKYKLDQKLVLQEFEAFILYWTEPNKTGTKQLWQMKKTFEVTRRLYTWFKNIKQTPKKYDL